MTYSIIVGKLLLPGHTSMVRITLIHSRGKENMMSHFVDQHMIDYVVTETGCIPLGVVSTADLLDRHAIP